MWPKPIQRSVCFRGQRSQHDQPVRDFCLRLPLYTTDRSDFSFCAHLSTRPTGQIFLLEPISQHDRPVIHFVLSLSLNTPDRTDFSTDQSDFCSEPISQDDRPVRFCFAGQIVISEPISQYDRPVIMSVTISQHDWPVRLFFQALLANTTAQSNEFFRFLDATHGRSVSEVVWPP